MSEGTFLINGDSILDSIKKLLGLSVEDTAFNDDIIIHINTVLSSLTQMGIGPEEGIVIFDSSSLWSDVIGDSKKLQQIKTYVFHKVRLMFDPPENTNAIESINRICSELEWRLYVEKGGY